MRRLQAISRLLRSSNSAPSFCTGLLCLLFVLSAVPAFSSSIAITNASFEMHDPFNRPCTSTNCYDITDPIGWTRANGPFQGQFAPDSSFFLNLPLPDGTVVAYSNGGSLYQILSQGVAANTGYTLQVNIGRRSDCCNGLPNMIPGIPDTPAVMDIELRAGGVTGTLLAINTINVSSIPLGAFANYAATFSGSAIPPAGNLTIVLNTTGIEGIFDNVRLDSFASTTSPVPEPASVTMVLAALGFFCIGRNALAKKS